VTKSRAFTQTAIAMVALAVVGAPLGTAWAAGCADYEKVSTMAKAKFAGAQTRAYGIIWTEIVDAFPGAKACTRINDSGKSPDYTIDGLYCRFEDADGTARHTAMVSELKKCLKGWSKTEEPTDGGGTNVAFAGPDPLAAWKVDLTTNQQGSHEATLRYELKVATPPAAPNKK
jgi:hypothetical protein